MQSIAQSCFFFCTNKQNFTQKTCRRQINWQSLHHLVTRTGFLPEMLRRILENSWKLGSCSHHMHFAQMKKIFFAGLFRLLLAHLHRWEFSFWTWFFVVGSNSPPKSAQSHKIVLACEQKYHRKTILTI